MGRKTISGLYQRNGIWHINKRVRGYGRLYESTGTGDREEAEQYLIHRLEEVRKATIYGVKPDYSFRQAAIKYLVQSQKMRSFDLSKRYLEAADEFIGHLPLEEVHDETLQPLIKARLAKGNSIRTINIILQRVVRVLHLAACKWRDPATKKFWLEKVPLITMLSDEDAEEGKTKPKREPYPLSWEEQRIFFPELPGRIQRMSLFKVNTGTREQEVCKLKWEWEVRVAELNTSVFIIPPDFGGRKKKDVKVKTGVKNGEVRLVVLNEVAKSVIEEQRGEDPVFVFGVSRSGKPLTRIYNTSWKLARGRAAKKYKEEFNKEAPFGFRNLRVHDLKHTFGRRLRAAGVPYEDRQVLLGHKTKSVTTDYSAVELANVIAQANKIATKDLRSAPTLTILKRKTA
jgi:integrase